MGGHIVLEASRGALHIDHKAIALRGSARIALTREKVHHIRAGSGGTRAPLRHQCRIAQAGQPGSGGGDRQAVDAVELQLGQQVRARGRIAQADAGHAIEFGKRAQHHHVFACGNHVDHAARALREVDIRLIHHQHAAFGLVRQCVVQVLACGDGAGGIVGVADVDDARVGIGRAHGLYIVRKILAQRHLDQARAIAGCRTPAGFVGGVGSDQRGAGRSECQHRVVERFGGPGVRHQMIHRQLELGSQGGHQFHLYLAQIPPALRCDLRDGPYCGSRRSLRKFIGVDHYRCQRRCRRGRNGSGAFDGAGQQRQAGGTGGAGKQRGVA